MISSRRENTSPTHHSFTYVQQLLLARGIEGLNDCKMQIEAVRQESFPDQETSVMVEQVDLGNLASLQTVLNSHFDEIKDANYSRGFCFLNAGSLGFIGGLQDLTEVETLKRDIDLNVTSPLWIASKFVSIFGAGRPEEEDQATKADEGDKKESSTANAEEMLPSFLVNISSLCAVQPFSSMASYCMTRAGKHMAMRVIAEEQKHSNKLKVLNWAPGPMETAMTDEIIGSRDMDAGIRESFEKMKQDHTFVPMESSAYKCLMILKANDFESGAHIDYFDETSVDRR